jgi:glycosyltransferase involved in cell wall biosynthesis
MTPLATAVVPTRDRRASLALALRTVLWQQEVELEVIVIDDASTDGTDGFVRQLDDPRVRLLRNETPQGVSAARNRGIAEARGEWIAFLDDDDLWAPDKLRRQLDALHDTGRAWAYGGEVIVDEQLRVLGGSPPSTPKAVVEALGNYDAVPGGVSSVVVARDILARVGPFDPQLSTSEDWDMWIRFARTGPPACVARPLVAVRLGRGSSHKMAKMVQELDVIAQRHGIRVDRARHCRWAAWEALREGRRLEALRYYAAAVAAGDPASIGRGAVALIWPRYPDRRLGRRAKADEWTAEAGTWLRALLTLEGCR